jgi:hypothetical protein
VITVGKREGNGSLLVLEWGKGWAGGEEKQQLVREDTHIWQKRYEILQAKD